MSTYLWVFLNYALLFFVCFLFVFLITDASILTAIAYCNHCAMATLSLLQVGKYLICFKNRILVHFYSINVFVLCKTEQFCELELLKYR